MSAVDSILIDTPRTAAQRRTYAARLALARKRFSAAAPDVKAMDTELKALRKVAAALTDLDAAARVRVLTLVQSYLGQ